MGELCATETLVDVSEHIVFRPAGSRSQPDSASQSYLLTVDIKKRRKLPTDPQFLGDDLGHRWEETASSAYQ